jgi:uncharacterized protein
MECEPSNRSCLACGRIASVDAFFCAACGGSLDSSSPTLAVTPMVRAREAWRQVRIAAAFYVALLLELFVFAILTVADATVTPFVVLDVMTLVTIIAFGWTVRRQVLGLLDVPRMDTTAWLLLIFGTAAAWLLNEGVLSLARGLPTVLEFNLFADLRQAGASPAAVLALTCVTPPILEELAFRGVLIERLRDAFGVEAAIVVVSVLFSILHLAVLSFVPFAGLAIVLGMLRIRTGSLWPAVAGHALFNLASFAFDG